MSNTEQTTTTTTAVAKASEKTVDAIISRVNDFVATGDIKLPPNYVPENAVRSAWLILQDLKDKNGNPALDVCTKESVANAFLRMVIKGLSVVKGQGYFVVYGKDLKFDESYIGDIAIAKRDAGVLDVKAQVIYKNDEFEYQTDVQTGRMKIIKHVQKFENISMGNILGAYAIATLSDGTYDTEIMTKEQITAAWNQSPTKGQSPAHKNFPDEMSKKTVIGRLLKVRNGSSNDEALFGANDDQTTASVNQEVKEKANKQELEFDKHTVVETKPIPVEEAKEAVLRPEPAKAGQPLEMKF